MHGPQEGQYIVPGTWPGLLQMGNIELASRPVVRNPDGSISTVRSASFGVGGHEVLLPTVVNGAVVSPRQAFQHYLQTGQHLGVFKSPEAANAYAQALHLEQARLHAAAAQHVQSALAGMHG